MEERVVEIILEILRREGKSIPDNIEGSSRLKQDLGFDSLMLAVLTVKIENEFGVDIFENGLVGTVVEVNTLLKDSRK